MITHDELIFCLLQKYPNLTHGVDFWVGQTMCRDTGKQLEPARIIAWHVSEEAPTEAEVAVLIEQYGEAAHCHVAGRAVREERDRRLKVADSISYKAMDFGDTERIQLAGQYRQALRDVPKQDGFPDSVTWPVLPETLIPLQSVNDWR